MSLDLQRFQNPPASFRGAPFWALNHDLTNHDRLREHIDAFAEMGLGGYHLHVRCGLQTPYMGQAFLDTLKAARDYGASKGMLSYLYDEDTWPSGWAGGAVTTELQHRRNWMELRKGQPTEPPSAMRTPVCAYRIEQDEDGKLISAERIDYDAGDETCWRLTHVIAPNVDRYNGASYVDSISPTAIRAFIDFTHETLLKSFGGEFPADVPAIFTDEPNFGPNSPLREPFDGQTTLAWTGDLRDSFRAAWDVELLDILPCVVWPRADGDATWRWRYWDHLAGRFAQAYSQQIGDWCAEHNIASTGHMLHEDDLTGQAGSTGESMRHYPHFQIPGIDLLCDQYLPATAKQAVSVARQEGKSQVMSELYGVTNWDFPFAGHKAQGDWQAALGINLRVPHLAWLSMEGSSKRDYPAVIGLQSPWRREYKMVEDHFARVGAALNEGQALVRIGVVHPVESIWVKRGVNSLDNANASECEQTFNDTLNWLLDAGLDFDFIAESLLPQQERHTADPVWQVGKMSYDVVVLPPMETIRQSTLDSLESFLKRGGVVIALGKLPKLCNGKLSDAPTTKLCNAKLINSSAIALRDALEPWREVAFEQGANQFVGTINHQLRQVGEERILFCSNRARTDKPSRPWAPFIEQTTIRIKGHWRVRELCTAKGVEHDCAYHQADGWTVIPWQCHPQSHRLLRLTPGEGEHTVSEPTWQAVRDLPEPLDIQRVEPNVYLLDQAEWRIDDEPWQPAEDTLMVQLKLAERFGWPDWGQPYSVKNPGPKRRVSRRYTLHCKVNVPDSLFMCERLNETSIMLNGAPLPAQATGWWVDRDLPTMALPALAAGDHVLEITQELDGVQRYLEWCYVLGDFDVVTRGAHAWIVAQEAKFWGDLTRQGLPFYGDNLNYIVSIEITEAGRYALRCPDFGGALLRVWCDGRDCGPVAYSPYRIELGELAPGAHELRIRCYGTRMNTFGALHNNCPNWTWWGPPAWRLDGQHRNNVWRLRPTGILRAPMLERTV
ncbi:hypothetical protein [Cerasicoccus frondis]|uniref:hypothetical protein n=1 Tax=Cerasicoccus frondis TaxID=490090 RepID=UPI002852D987|nr:hypothetical protein [Cerasicoccus frondis]